jgi:hypothetical protein
MFDVYQKKSDPMERVVVVHGSSLPAIFPSEEWRLLEKVNSVSANIGAYITKNDFYIYRTRPEVKGEDLRYL